MNIGLGDKDTWLLDSLLKPRILYFYFHVQNKPLLLAPMGAFFPSCPSWFWVLGRSTVPAIPPHKIQDQGHHHFYTCRMAQPGLQTLSLSSVSNTEPESMFWNCVSFTNNGGDATITAMNWIVTVHKSQIVTFLTSRANSNIVFIIHISQHNLKVLGFREGTWLIWIPVYSCLTFPSNMSHNLSQPSNHSIRPVIIADESLGEAPMVWSWTCTIFGSNLVPPFSSISPWSLSTIRVTLVPSHRKLSKMRRDKQCKAP